MDNHPGILVVDVAHKVPCYSCVRSLFTVKDVTSESINDSIYNLSHIFNVAPKTFLEINKIAVLIDSIPDGTVGFFFIK